MPDTTLNALIQLARQYRLDMQFVPAADSRARRIEWIDDVLKLAEAAPKAARPVLVPTAVPATADPFPPVACTWPVCACGSEEECASHGD